MAVNSLLFGNYPVVGFSATGLLNLMLKQYKMVVASERELEADGHFRMLD